MASGLLVNFSMTEAMKTQSKRKVFIKDTISSTVDSHQVDFIFHFAEQFYNEKLLFDVSKIGASVGSKVNELWINIGRDVLVRKEEIPEA
ncbi:hypothetical protein RYX36_003454 [Vicia faba]